MKRAALLLPFALMLQGCLAKTVLDVATAPVKVAGGAVDLATTSQSEADEKRGRELRKQEERLGKLNREYGEESERCERGNAKACAKAAEIYDEMQALRSTTMSREPEQRRN